MNRSLLIILGAACAGLAALNIYQFVDRQSLRDEIAADKHEAKAIVSNAGRQPVRSAPQSPGAKPTKAPANRDPKSPSVVAGAEGPQGEGFQEVAKKWAEMMQNPVMKKQMQAQMEAQVGPALADLYAHFGLEGEDLKHFKGLISEHWLAQQQVGMKMMSAAGDPEKTAGIKEELKKSREGTEAKVREFLNDEEDFAYFKTYQKQLPDRVELEQFTGALSEEGMALSETQKNQLLTAMGEERVASELGDVTDPEGWDFENFNEGTVTDVMGKMTDFHQRVQGRAGTVLDEEQIQVLTSSQEQYRSMQEVGMRMGLEMMKNMTGEK